MLYPLSWPEKRVELKWQPGDARITLPCVMSVNSILTGHAERFTLPSKLMSTAPEARFVQSTEEVTRAVTLHSFPDADLERAWRTFLLTADFPTHYVSPEYFHEPFFAGKRQFAILALKGSTVTGVITGMHDRHHVVCGVSGRPQVALSPSAGSDVFASLLGALRAEAGSSTLISVFSWLPLPAFRDDGFTEREIDAIVMLDLRLGRDALFKGFNKGRKSDINFAARKGVEVRLTNSDADFSAYYEIYSTWCDRKKIEPQSIETMRAAFGLESNRVLFMAFHEGVAIAGSVVRFVSSGIAEYSANNSVEAALHLRPNSLLNWVAIQWACEQGLRGYSMGGSHPFLRHFGGDLLPIYRYRIDLSLFKRHERREQLEASARGVARAVRQRLRSNRDGQ